MTKWFSHDLIAAVTAVLYSQEKEERLKKMKNSIAVIGNGFVGGSLTTVFAERGFDVFVYDKAGKVAKGGIDPSIEIPAVSGVSPRLVRPIRSVAELVSSCEAKKGFSKIYFVCLPTPMSEDGSADLSIVDGVLRDLSSIPGDRIAVVKSTVPPGSVKKWNEEFKNTGLQIVFNPEFLTEANALDDMRNQNRIVLGGPRPWINKVKQVFQTAFPNVPIVKTSSTNAELVKYFTNIHLAARVSLSNEFYQICEALDRKGLDVDYDKVMEYAQYDKRLGGSHMRVPSFETDDDGNPLYGFSLSCFCKDINALMFEAKKVGVDPKVMSGVWEKNLEVRPGRDWLKLVGRAVSAKKT